VKFSRSLSPSIKQLQSIEPHPHLHYYRVIPWPIQPESPNAEALIEAASLESDALTQKQLANNLDSLKSSFDVNLNKVVQKIQSSNENFDAKMDTLQQHVNLVKCEIGALNVMMVEESKQKTLERALLLTDLNSFDY